MINKNNFIRWNDASSYSLDLIGKFSNTIYYDSFLEWTPEPKFTASTTVFDYLEYDGSLNPSSLGYEFVGFEYNAYPSMKFKVDNYSAYNNSNYIRIYARNRITKKYDTLLYESDNTPGVYANIDVSITVDSSYDRIKVGHYNMNRRSRIGGYLYVHRSTENINSLYFPKLIKDEEVSIYVNFDSPISTTFGNLAVGLALNYELQYYDITILQQTIKPDGTYRLFFKFTVPILIRGCYQFVIYDEANYDDWLYVSNFVEYVDEPNDYQKTISYFNTNDILGYEFEDVGEPAKIGLDLFVGMPQFSEKATAYRLYDGKTKRVRSAVREAYQCQARYFDEYALKALQAALLMDSVTIGNIEVFTEDAAITPDWIEKDQLTTLADFQVIDEQYKLDSPYHQLINWYSSIQPSDQFSLKISAGDVVNFFDTGLYLYATQIDLYSYTEGAVIQSDITPILNDGPNNYFEWTVGDLPTGVYCLKNFTDYSTPFCYVKNTEDTVVLKWRNERDIFGFNYTGLASWYNQVRISGNILPGSPNSDSAGFNDYDNQYHRSQSFVNDTKEFNIFQLDEPAHKGLFSVLVHDEIYIDGVRYMKPPEAGYSINWPDTEHKQADAKVNLEVYNDYDSILL